ncbi:hypothetical protein HY029_02795 [Candidatus Gottesmanbacteria bacterium]|nr:hypothetical protein [Candidatus Gottesmanbacteria bacterium]
MSKYEEYYQKMIDQNLDLFGEFQEIHDNYALNPTINQMKYNEIGAKVVEVIRDWEKKLCKESEGGQYGVYSVKLADKFWGLVRKDYPKIDFVGVK